MDINITRGESTKLPPITEMSAYTDYVSAAITAKEINDGSARAHFGTRVPATQVVYAKDCDDLVEFFTQLAAELRRTTSNNR